MDIKHRRLLKKITAGALITVLLAGAFSGCKKDDPTDASTAPVPQDTQAAPAVTDPTTLPPENLIGGTVTADELNVREGVGVKYEVVKKLYKDDRVEIIEQQDLNGVMWGRIQDGWICLAYVHIDGTPLDEEPEKVEQILENPIVGKVIAKELNIRSGPGTNHDVCGHLAKDDEVTVTELKGNWGKTENGWINVIFAYFPDSLDSTFMETKVTANELNVRSGPGTSYESLKKLNNGDAVTIWKFVTVNNVQWGYIGDGWICTKYVEQQPLHPND